MIRQVVPHASKAFTVACMAEKVQIEARWLIGRLSCILGQDTAKIPEVIAHSRSTDQPASTPDDDIEAIAHRLMAISRRLHGMREWITQYQEGDNGTA